MNETCSLEEVLKIRQLPFPGKGISQEKQPTDHWAGGRGLGGGPGGPHITPVFWNDS